MPRFYFLAGEENQFFIDYDSSDYIEKECNCGAEKSFNQIVLYEIRTITV